MPADAKIKYLLIHTSDSKWGSVEVIRQWHTDPPPKGRGWADIGYHFCIQNQFPTYNSLATNKPDTKSDGQLRPGRPLAQMGAHCVGFNDKSIGICLVGAQGKYTAKQLETLKATCISFMKKYNIPVENVLGHYETDNGKSQGKTCPDIDMVKYRLELAAAIKLG